MRPVFVCLTMSGALALAATFATGVNAQVKKGKTRPLLTKQLMGGLVGPTCGTLGKEIQGSGPADSKAWEAAGTWAALLNESGYVLMEDGRCPDAVWAQACKALQEGSATLLVKIEAKDAAGAQQAFAAVSASCKSCHSAHKKPVASG